MQDLFRQLRQARVIDLAQPWFAGMPHWPTHPPFAMARTKEHGEYVLEGGVSSAAELIALGTHVGTHIDGLGHFSCGGRLFEGRSMEEAGIDRLAPVLRRAVWMDAAPGGELAEDAEIGAQALEAGLSAPVEKGDVVLIRTGWGRRWRESKRFINGQRQPGIGLDAARWLSAKGVFAVGADNVALERIPSPRMAVHAHLLVEAGVHIMECLNLEGLAEERCGEFLFVAAPLKIEGATGAPMRPFALVKGV